MEFWDKIKTLDDFKIQSFLREIDVGDLAIAMTIADEKAGNCIFRNVSERAGEIISEDIQRIQADKSKDIDVKGSIEKGNELLNAVLKKGI